MNPLLRALEQLIRNWETTATNHARLGSPHTTDHHHDLALAYRQCAHQLEEAIDTLADEPEPTWHHPFHRATR